MASVAFPDACLVSEIRVCHPAHFYFDSNNCLTRFAMSTAHSRLDMNGDSKILTRTPTRLSAERPVAVLALIVFLRRPPGD
jgi:hypothetical protein